MLYPKWVESKTSANKVTNIVWNPRIDLLATVFGGEVLTCSHLLSLQKVWHKNINGKIISIAWRPDGRVLAMGIFDEKVEEHVCTLHDVENGKKIMSIKFDKAITSINWFQYCSPSEDDNSKGEAYLPSTKKSVSNDKGTQSIASNETSFSHQLAYDQTNLNILMVSTVDNKISFYALGLFYLGSMIIPTNDTQMNSKIIETHMSNCMKYITVLVKYPTSLVSEEIFMKIYRYDLFDKRSSDILRVAKMYAKIKDELEYLDDTINAITTSWADVLAGLDSKLSSYCSRKNKNPDDSDNNYTFLSADELLQLLVIGYPSDNLEKFLTDMSDKGLNKLNNAIEQTCLRVQNLIVKNAQKCCYHMHADLNKLRGMSLWYDRYEKVGLNDKFIVEAMKGVGSLMLKLTELQQVIDHSLKSTKSFFKWLVSIASRMMGEQNTSGSPNDLNKTTQQDIQLITDFILENFDYNSNDLDMIKDGFSTDLLSKTDTNNSNYNSGNIQSNRPTCSNFTLEQVGQYLKNEPLSRLKYSFAKPNSNFWIEFFQKRPELTDWKELFTDSNDDKSTTILFYPHNEDTSLIQEYKNTCKTTQKVFKCVPKVIEKTLYEPAEKIEMDFCFDRIPMNRIRVETDERLQQHYTLFHTRPQPTTKQYLMVHSLVDATVKIYQIQFKTKPERPERSCASTSADEHNLIRICDSSFYEIKKDKKFLLTFLLLDSANCNTLILQVELDKLLDDYKRYSIRCHDLDMISEESMEGICTKIVIELDINSEPPESRVYPHNIMVKKIKNINGRDMYSSSGRGVIAFTSSCNTRLHLYELELASGDCELVDDDIEESEKVDESLIDTEPVA